MLDSPLGTGKKRPIRRELKSDSQEKQFVLSGKDKQMINSLLKKGEKGTDVALTFKIGKPKRNNKEKILKFIDRVEMREGLKIGNTYSQ